MREKKSLASQNQGKLDQLQLLTSLILPLFRKKAAFLFFKMKNMNFIFYGKLWIIEV